MTKEYEEYLKSPEWRYIRNIVVKRDDNKCTKCGSETKLRVHHTTYKHIFHELNYLIDLITLCKSCHDTFHEAKTKPIRVVNTKKDKKVRQPRQPREKRTIIRRVLVVKETPIQLQVRFCCNNMLWTFKKTEYKITRTSKKQSTKSDYTLQFSCLIWKLVMKERRRIRKLQIIQK